MQPWQEVLKSVGFPTTALVIDFESYYDNEYTLSNLSHAEYINDERFDFTGVGLTLMDEFKFDYTFVPGPMVVEYMTNVDMRAVTGPDCEEITVVMQNAPFDARIMLDKLGIDCPYVIDVKDLANHLESR